METVIITLVTALAGQALIATGLYKAADKKIFFAVFKLFVKIDLVLSGFKIWRSIDKIVTHSLGVVYYALRFGIRNKTNKASVEQAYETYMRIEKNAKFLVKHTPEYTKEELEKWNS